MTLDFDLRKVTVTEFGVGRDQGSEQSFVAIPIDKDVQDALGEIAEATWNMMEGLTSAPTKYEPSEKYASQEYVYLPLDDNLASLMQQLQTATNLPVDSNALNNPSNIFCYFARFTDITGRHLTGLRRASQFKAVVKSRLIQVTTNALRLVKDKTFKLDMDFDLLIDSKNIHILRPSGFEFAAELQQAVLAAVPTNIVDIKNDLTFVEFSTIEKYAGKHPRAARCLASIRSQGETKNINKTALKKLCKSTGVQISESNGKIVVKESEVLGFLEVLDRRRYELELVRGSPERFRAESRSRLRNQGVGV